MNRPFLRPLTGLSVVALATVLVLWATSYYRCRLFSRHGRVLILIVEASPDADSWLRANPPTAGTWEDLRPKGTRRAAGVELSPLTTITRYEYTYYNGPVKGASYLKLRYAVAAVPYWLLAVAAGAMPVARLAWVLRRCRRIRAGHCADCGYDLRATPNRCPECGTIVTRVEPETR